MPATMPASHSLSSRASAGFARGSVAGASWRDFLTLMKPGVISLVVFTGACGLLVAPGSLPVFLKLVAILCIAVGAGGAAAFNHWWEAETDALMKRTANRPLPAGRMHPDQALAFAILLSVGSVTTLGLAANWLAAGWLALSIFYYAVIYTMWLKPRTPHNTVIGGAAGAFPPIIGWAAVTGHVTLLPVLLFLIIFAWTPPHFWALALFVRADYSAAGFPMLPVTHGIKATRQQILLYSVILTGASLAPWALGLAGAVYGIVAALLGAGFLWLALAVWRSPVQDHRAMRAERVLFAYSIVYLFALFGALVVDHTL